LCSPLLSLEHVTRHTSHVTRHTSHVTRHTSHVTRRTLHVTRHTSHVTRHTSHVTRRTSHVTRDFSTAAQKQFTDKIVLIERRHAAIITSTGVCVCVMRACVCDACVRACARARVRVIMLASISTQLLPPSPPFPGGSDSVKEQAELERLMDDVNATAQVGGCCCCCVFVYVCMSVCFCACMRAFLCVFVFVRARAFMNPPPLSSELKLASRTSMK